MSRVSVDIAGLRRHGLVWLAPEWHQMVCAQVTDAVLRDIARRFLAAGWPLVMCRQPGSVEDAPAQDAPITLGMPLPPAQGKHRLAFAVPRAAIVRTAPPPLLATTIPHLPATWREPLRHLLRDAEAIDIEFRVFGSLAWEGLTGNTYLTPQSDVDVLWRPSEPAQIADAIALLRAWQAEAGIAVDGEIVFGDDAAVAWREWSGGDRTPDTPHRVLVKTLRGPRLCARADLLARLPRHRRPLAQTQVCA